MFLKSLTLKGFKSFAEKTTLEFEPGVTVVVGPNGSGKSNLVDAVAWVLGAQGARALRGGKMDDVIFAGTADRPALGRAEVSLTIDNASQLLPIEFSEVTITRTLFRTGESEYAINGAPCRLLDIQELLSDSGIGRQQHVIVGQGQLDTVLNARPEDRRAIIEEAAGVLKYRKRKEKAERRLEATEANLLRLTDLLREVRRQLRPLERQADAARRHDGLTEALREIRLHLAGRDIEVLTTRLGRRRASRSELGDQRGRAARAAARARRRRRERGARSQPPRRRRRRRPAAARRVGARTRSRACRRWSPNARAASSASCAAAADEGVVETLVADAAAVRDELVTVDADHEALRPLLDAARVAARARRGMPRRARRHRRATARRAPRRRAGVRGRDRPVARGARAARRVARAASTRSPTTFRRCASSSRPRRPRSRALEPERQRAHEQRAVAAEAFRAIEATVEPEHGPEGDERRAGRAGARGRERGPAQRRIRSRALARPRRDARGRARRGAARPRAARSSAICPACSARCSTISTSCPAPKPPSRRRSGERLHALVVDGGPAARAAVERLRDGEASALLLVADRFTRPSASALTHPADGRPLLECVRSRRADLDALVRSLLARVVLVEAGWRAALDLALDDPEIVAVTRDGDRFGGPTPWRAGPAGRSAVTPSDARRRPRPRRRRRGRRGREPQRARVGAAPARCRTRRRGQRAPRPDRPSTTTRVATLAAAESAVRDTETALASATERQSSLELRLAELEPRLLDLPARAAEAERAVADGRRAARTHLRRALDAATAAPSAKRRRPDARPRPGTTKPAARPSACVTTPRCARPASTSGAACSRGG